MTKSNEQIVLDFCKAWSRRNCQELLGYFADDAIYHNIPMPAVQGKDAIEQVFDMFLPISQKIEWEMKQLVGQGNLVFTERVDRFWMGDKTVELPVAGVFELEDGKIKEWRDYFDLATWTRQTGM
ncbi:MAG TPA: limonene-1,2-epoxide hydrolase family protein [Candidatus Limnocylindrales bacterium]|nr:limonene-1,2-epoxide hydrolase family protein [Candidatus Limnocylindrales bacterium]